MPVLFSIIFGGLLLAISYQDFRFRALSAVLVIGAILLAVIYSIFANGLSHALVYLGINILLIIVQLAGITMYFSLKQKRIVSIVNTYLGSGDLWFYGVLACSFSPMNFVVFNLATCFIILIIFAFQKENLLKNKAIPLAGCLAISMLLVLLAGKIFLFVNPFDDYILLSYL